MSVIRTAFILGFMLSLHQTASAACILATQKIVAPPETVTEKRAVQSGGVIQTRTLSVRHVQSAGCTESQSFTAQVAGDPSVMALPGILRSNVSGIGIKVSFETSTGRHIPWPSTFKATPDEFRNSKINIELIKLDNRLPAGASPGSLNLQIRSETQSLPVIDIVLPAKYVTVLSRSCTIQGNRTINVKLPDVALEHFTGYGSTAGRKPFTIDLTCKGEFTTPSRVVLSWSDAHKSQARNMGVLPNIQPKGATGIGIQVLNQHQQPIDFNRRAFYTLTHQDKGKFSIPFHAQYFQTEQRVSPGKVRSVLYFNAEYE